MIPSEVYALGASGNPIREIADYAMRRAEEVGAENVYDFSIGSPSIAPPAAAQEAAGETAALATTGRAGLMHTPPRCFSPLSAPQLLGQSLHIYSMALPSK